MPAEASTAGALTLGDDDAAGGCSLAAPIEGDTIGRVDLVEMFVGLREPARRQAVLNFLGVVYDTFQRNNEVLDPRPI